jgi:glucose-1-phosphate adenylyltransferase
VVSGGCIVSGATLRQSLLSVNATVAQYSYLEGVVALPDARIGQGCRLHRVIVDEDVVIPDGTVIGENPEEDRRKFYVTRGGVTLVTADMMVEDEDEA